MSCYSLHETTEYQLCNEFVSSYRDKQPPFGFNGLGEMVYMRTYSRPMANGQQEQWYQTVERVMPAFYVIF